jgi:hypothetical protein
VSEDDVKHAEKDLQKLHDDFMARIDAAMKARKPRSWRSEPSATSRAGSPSRSSGFRSSSGRSGSATSRSHSSSACSAR